MDMDMDMNMNMNNDSFRSTIRALNRDALNRMALQDQLSLLEQMNQTIATVPVQCSLNDLERLAYLNELDKKKYVTWIWQCLQQTKEAGLVGLNRFIDGFY